MLDSLFRRMLVKPDIASATEKHLAPFHCPEMHGVVCLGTQIALLIVFDGSKRNSKFFPGISVCHVTTPSCRLKLSGCLSFAFHFAFLFLNFGMLRAGGEWHHGLASR